MISAFHRMRADEDGQALALGAVMLLVLAVALLGFSKLSLQVHDRIALQDGADAAAYSLAVEEARAFNVYAYTNRAQIAQYVTVLQLLSVDAMLLGILAGLGTFAAVSKTIGELCAGPKALVCMEIPILGSILVGLSRTLAVVEKIVLVAGRAIEAFDLFVGEVAVPLLVASNLFLFAHQVAAHGGVLAKLLGDEGLDLARVAAPRAAWAAPVQALNAAHFEQAHLRESMTLWGDGDREGAGLAHGAAGRRNWARRGMAELVHATRSGGWVYDRSFPGGLGGMLGGVEAFDVVQELLHALPAGGLRGHTRLLSLDRASPGASQAIYEAMEKPGYGAARYPTGNAIGANFTLDVGGSLLDGGLGEKLGIGLKHMASVTSTSSRSGGGWACTWDVRRPYERYGVPGALEVFVPRFSCDVARGRHPWWGITPYMAFNAPGAGCDRFAAEFCQPDVWVALEDGNAKAVARALAYYHRPGDWQEPPNFFNPYWRAKLAPVEPGLDRLGAAGNAVRRLLEIL